MATVEDLRRRWRAIRGDIRDLVAQGGMTVETPADQGEGLIAMTVVQPDGDVVARFQRSITVDAIAAHNRDVKNRLRDVRNTITLCVNAAIGILATASALLIAQTDGIENHIIRHGAAVLGAVAAGYIGRYLAGQVMRIVANRLFTGFLNGGS